MRGPEATARASGASAEAGRAGREREKRESEGGREHGRQVALGEQ